jgi:hypothetical protein
VVVAKGKKPDDYPRRGFRGYLGQASEIAPLREALGFETAVVDGVEPAISADDDSNNKLEDKQRQLWLDLLVEMSAEKSMIASSGHLLYIAKKLSQSPLNLLLSRPTFRPAPYWPTQNKGWP